ncbi:hypothetical protein OE88DRAFT_1715060 [Heliocybe sulcata]|uniref:Uncharacterized protein n=1 Tax=Heliocybe sulcata TaxID=5364 RepID=A0A5C3MM12_9AGAM|nr:hypothetical protein OE88DRAFT_1715060 [Heliocybe sulcata]
MSMSEDQLKSPGIHDEGPSESGSGYGGESSIADCVHLLTCDGPCTSNCGGSEDWVESSEGVPELGEMKEQDLLGDKGYANSDEDSTDGDIVEYESLPEVNRQSPTATDEVSAGYQLDDIKVEYPPQSHRSTTVHAFGDFRKAHPPATSVPIDKEPWRPFRSRLDFDFAEFTSDAKLSRSNIDRLIKIIHCAIDKKDAFTFSNCEDVLKCWDTASYKVTTFEKANIVVPYKKIEQSFDFYYRPIWETTLDLLRDPHIVSQFEWDAQKLSKFNGDRFVRFWDEPWTADRMWNIQSSLPEGAKPLCFILYADKSKLSSFGTAKGYPIILRYGQLPVVGWLPVVAEESSETGKPDYVNFKNAVWHESFKQLLASVKQYSKTGIWVPCADGETRHLFPAILILTADYEEQSVMALIRGAKALHPCPICLIPAEEILDLSRTWPLRTTSTMMQEYEKAQTMNKTDADQHLKQFGLRAIDNVFWHINHSDPYEALAFDRLHANHHGLFGHHLFKEFQEYVAILGKSVAGRLDKQMAMLPTWPGLDHFSQFVNTSWNDGSKENNIAKQLLFAAQSEVDRRDHPALYTLLCCIRSYLEQDMYAALEVHTEDTLDALGKEIEKFEVLLKQYIAAQKPEEKKAKEWLFPKVHIRSHIVSNIRTLGATRNNDTKPNEKMHRPIRQDYLRTNFKNIAEPILRANQNNRVALFIREQLDHLDHLEKLQREEALEGVQGSAQLAKVSKSYLECGHVRLGAACRPISLETVEAMFAPDPAFKDFRKKLGSFLTNLMAAYQIPVPNNKPIVLQKHDMVKEYRYLRVRYESAVDWCERLDQLRCSPEFYERPQYDCVMINTGAAVGDQPMAMAIFTRLVFVFTFKVGNTRYPVALIHPYDAPTGTCRTKDRDLGFYRLRAKPRSAAEFVDVRTIIRGALLAQDFGKDGDYLVVDSIDTDMFLRMKSMYRGR